MGLIDKDKFKATAAQWLAGGCHLKARRSLIHEALPV